MTLTIPSVNLMALLPQIVVAGAALVVLMADLILREKRALGLLSFLGVGGALGAVAWLWWLGSVPAFQNMAVADHYALVVNVIILIAAGLGILLSLGYVAHVTPHQGTYYALLLLAAAGMMTMGAATDLVTIFLALEILSLSLYILAGFNQADARSGEAALKYFLLGAFASAFFLYGVTLVYAAMGTTNLVALTLRSFRPDGPMLLMGVGLLTVGFGFKVALVPFQQWTPDVYQGAPTPVTAFMSVGTKAAGFAAFVRVILVVLPGIQDGWIYALAALAVLTMTVGNLAALRQASLKRMLAYSSIAHAGYVLVGITALESPAMAAAMRAVFFYLLAYGFMNIGAFAVLVALERAGEGDVDAKRMQGLAARRPLLAALMALFMLSLAGIPPLAGFFGKLYVFSAAVQAGWAWLAVVGVLNSVISAYYYLGVTVGMYMQEAPEGEAAVAPARGFGLTLALALTALGTVLLGLWSAPWLQFAARSAVAFIGGG
jgi:NADH-quinone oxidoreductase subunit N